jgi:regulator of RNase E activity RraA
VPIQCGGVPVNPGDLVMADDNGVLIISPEVAADVIEMAEKIEAQEASLRIYLADGGSLAERSGANRLLRDKFRMG